MAVNNETPVPSSAGRRFFFGTNVVIAILLLAVIVVAANWFGHRKNWRRDVAGGFTGTQLSERARSVLGNAGPDLRITTIYTSDEPETDRKKYFGKVQDLTEEIRQFNKNIKVEHLFSGNERADLRKRVQSKFGSAAARYDEVINETTALWDDLDKALTPLRTEMTAFLQGDSWLSDFSTLANLAAVLKRDAENLEQTRREIDELVRGEALPRYQEANSKIRSTNDELKRHLESMQKWMQEMQNLLRALSDSGNEFVARTREQLTVMAAHVAELRRHAGDPEDPNVPDDPKPVLQEYARAAQKLANWLVEESARVGAFVKAHPALERHPRWQVQVQQGVFVAQMPLTIVLGKTGEELSQAAQVVREALRQNVAKDQLQSLVRQVRVLTQRVDHDLATWNTGVLRLLEESAKIDPNSPEAQFIAKGADGETFKPLLTRLDGIATKISELPALEIDEIANRLQQENIVVVENDKDVRIVTFDEMWPLADQRAHEFMTGDEERQPRRIFAGDAAITNAVLSMTVEKPFATVIFVAFEPQQNPQMRQFQRNIPPQIPLEQLTILKEKLEQANFKVKDWNLGAEDSSRPEPEEGTEAVYVILPPAPRQPPNFMMQPQAPEKSFGEAELNKVKEVLASGARAIFLTAWEPPGGFFAPPTEYQYGDYLRQEWGIEVKPEYRVIRGVVDKNQPDQYAINISQWHYLQLTYFTDQPVGEPLRNRRVLVRDVCPVMKAETVPDGVKITPILSVPEQVNDIWAAQNDEILRIISSLRSPDRGNFTLGKTAIKPPFDVMLAAENENTKSKILVLGSGVSFRDDYLSQRIMRIEGKNTRLVTDPPPTENLDLFHNAVFWLSDQPQLIAAGPADVPVVPPLDTQKLSSVRLITFGWALLVLGAGVAVLFVRRK